MFRKFWKTLKFFLILAIILICLPHSILPKQTREVSKADLDYYMKLNLLETRLGEYRDDEEALKLKIKQLEIINKSRKKYGADEVRLDILASRVANMMCREAAEHNYLGHWNLAGEKPYHRYAFAGGYDHISENAYGSWSSDSYTISPASVSSMMKAGHDTFMEEKAPYDGHKRNIIDKSHNFAGIGYYISGKQFRYYEEFIDRYLEFEEIPSEASAGQKINLTIKTREGDFLYYLIAYREDFPRPVKPEQINKKGSYEDFTDEQYLTIPAWDLSAFRQGSVYRIPLTFTREGLYYIQIFTDKKEISRPSYASTKGKSPYSGIVIKVRN